MLWLKCLFAVGGIIFALAIGSPVLQRWKLALIWIGTIASFQAVQLYRYHEGKPYQPILGLVAAVMVVGLALHARGRLTAAKERELTIKCDPGKSVH
jgi:hypothetical protein